MRNLRRWPITLVEIEDCLLQLADEIGEKDAEEQRFGDMRPLLLRAAAKIVKRTGFVTYDLGMVQHETKVK